MIQLWPWIHTLMQGQFAAGGLLLMAVGSLLAMLKSIPLKIWDWVVRQTTVSMTITDDSDSFDWFKWWFQKHPSAENIRSLDAYTPYDNERRVFVTPGVGAHWLWHKSRPVRVLLERTENTTSYKRRQSFHLQTFGRNQQFMRELLTQCRTSYLEQTKNKSTMNTFNKDFMWERLDSYSPRALDSVILPTEVKTDLVQDIERFRAAKIWYSHLGIPYRRGYLLHGLPGSGKTSLISGIAQHFHLQVCPINLNSVTDTTLAQMIRKAPANALIMLEDIDCTGASEKRFTAEKKSSLEDLMGGLSLSGLLNALDGAQSANGTLFFMTTNHIDRLDPALLRAGRTDVKIEFRAATLAQKTMLYKRFFPEACDYEADEFLTNNPATTVAEFQGLLLAERNQRLLNTKAMEAVI